MIKIKTASLQPSNSQENLKNILVYDGKGDDEEKSSIPKKVKMLNEDSSDAMETG